MIIAEACQNWNGDLELLKDMVCEASRCGADAIKVQTFFADDLGEAWRSDYDRLKRLELSWVGHKKFVEWCSKSDIIPMTSVYSEKYLSPLKEIGFKYIKIGSAQAMDQKLIQACLKKEFQVIVSTGGQLEEQLPIEINNCHSVLHCVSKYPHTERESDLSRLLKLKSLFPYTQVGFSDHSDPMSQSWIKPCALSLYLGGTVIEKHFRVLPPNATKDGCVSINGKQLQQLSLLYKKSRKEILDEYPDFGLFHFPKKESEYKLIERYAKRWKVD